MGSRMLIYHPAQDANHCVFRALLILEHTVHDHIDINLYRLLDFYILFPHLLKDITPLPIELRAYSKLLKLIPEPFESMRNTHRILHGLEALQTASIHNLLAKRLLDIDSFKSKNLKRTNLPIPADLVNAITTAENTDKEWFRMVVNELPLIEFSGMTGLKKRAGLMEFRYDMEVS